VGGGLRSPGRPDTQSPRIGRKSLYAHADADLVTRSAAAGWRLLGVIPGARCLLAGRVDLLDQCLRLQQSPAPVLLAPRRLPSAEILGKRPWAIRSLSEVASFDGSKLSLDDQVLMAAGSALLIGSRSPRPGTTTAKRLPRSIGTPEAVTAAIKYMESKGLTETQFGNQFQSTDRTVRSFRKSGKMRRSTFEAMAKSMGLTIEELLRGESPKSDRP